MKSILVVDDNKDITGLFQTIFQTAGHNCEIANGGKEGLDLLRNHKFDLVLLDLAMPDMSGVQVLEKVKEDPKLAAHKIVVITASSPSESEMKRIMKEYQILDVIKKPINKKGLLQLVQRF